MTLLAGALRPRGRKGRRHARTTSASPGEPQRRRPPPRLGPEAGGQGVGAPGRGSRVAGGFLHTGEQHQRGSGADAGRCQRQRHPAQHLPGVLPATGRPPRCGPGSWPRRNARRRWPRGRTARHTRSRAGACAGRSAGPRAPKKTRARATTIPGRACPANDACSTKEVLRPRSGPRAPRRGWPGRCTAASTENDTLPSVLLAAAARRSRRQARREPVEERGPWGTRAQPRR